MDRDPDNAPRVARQPPPPPGAPKPELIARIAQDLTLAVLFSVARVRAIPMAITFGVILAVGIITTFSLTPLYTADAFVLFDSDNQNNIDLSALLNQQAGPPISIENQVEILTSTSFVGRLVDKLDLEVDPEYSPGSVASFSPIGEIRALFGASPNAPSADQKRAQTVGRVLRHLTAEVVPDSSVIEIHFSSDDPGKAARMANAVADNYITDQLEAKFEATRIANTWLSQRLAELRQRVNDAEREVASYAAANNLQAVDQAGQTIMDQRVASLNDDLIKARADLAAKEASYQGVKGVLARGGSVEAIPELMNTPIFQDLRAQRAALLQQKSQLSSTLGARHPEMIKLSQQLTSIDQQISAEIQRILAALQSATSVSQSQVSVMEQGLREAQGQTANASQTSIHLRELQRNAESAKSLYEAFLKRFNELGEQATLQTTNARVIGRATVPTSASFPKIPLSLAASAFVALFGAFAAGFLIEQLDRGLRTRHQVETELALPMLANLPLETELTWDDVIHDPSEVVVKKPLSAYNESFRLLRAGVQMSNVDSPPKIILVTSALPNEGKSTSAVSLARSAALSGDRVLLIDGDIRRSGISKILDLKGYDGPGLVQCVTGESKIREAVLRDKFTTLDILPPGLKVSNPPDILSSIAMRNLMSEVKSLYDVVIVDSAPVLPVIDSRLLGRLVDTAVFLVRWERTPKDAANEALRLLSDFNVPIAGVALSMTDRRKQKRYGYYGDGYSYYGHYKNYYESS